MAHTIREVLELRAWRVGIKALPMHMCYFSICYLILRTDSAPNIVATLLLVLAFALYFAYGVLINDHFDRKLDIASGKYSSKRGHTLSEKQVVVLVALLAVFGIAVVISIGGSILFDLLWAISFVLATLYSTPPVRLRVRGVVGFIVDSLIEKPLPVLIVFSFFGYFGIEAILFPIFAELLDSVLKHQMEDFDIDSAQGVQTFATELGKQRTRKVVDIIVQPLNALAAASMLVIVLVTLYRYLPIVIVSIFAVSGVVIFVFLESKHRVRQGFPFPDPPVVGYLNFSLRVFVLAGLAISAVSLHVQYIPLGILIGLSIILYAKEPMSLAPDFVNYMRGKSQPMPSE